MIGLLLGIVIFCLAFARLTVYMRKRYQRAGDCKYDRQGVYLDTALSTIMIAGASLVSGHVIAVAPKTLLIPVIAYGAYRGFRWWFENKIAK